MADGDKQIFTTYSLKGELKKRLKNLTSEVKETLGIKVNRKKSATKSKPTKFEVTKKPPVAKQEKPPSRPESDSEFSHSETVNSAANPTKLSEFSPEEAVAKDYKLIKKNVSEESARESQEAKERAVLTFIAILIIAIFVYAIVSSFKYLRLSTKTLPIGLPKNEEQFCGGIANIKCPEGFYCKLEGKYPDAGGNCVKASVLNNL